MDERIQSITDFQRGLTVRGSVRKSELNTTFSRSGCNTVSHLVLPSIAITTEGSESRRRSVSPLKPPRRSKTERTPSPQVSDWKVAGNHASIRRPRSRIALPVVIPSLVKTVVKLPFAAPVQANTKPPTPPVPVRMVLNEKPLNLCGFILLPAKHANEEPQLLESKDFQFEGNSELVFFRKTWPTVPDSNKVLKREFKSDLCLPLLERVGVCLMTDVNPTESLKEGKSACELERRRPLPKIKTAQDKWYTSVDKQGRLYYFEENSNESVWVLPDVQPVTSEKPSQPSRKSTGTTPENLLSCGEKENLHINPSPGSVRPRQLRDGSGSVDRKVQAMSQSFLDSSFSSEALTRSDVTVKTASLPRDTSHLPYLNVIRHGLLNKTKITENGKKTRKHWTTSYCILSDQFLLLYKDKKSATQSRPGSTPAKPELSLDLNGSSSEWCANKSSRKNVFQLSTIFGLQILLQDEDGISARQWYEAIRSAIGQLPSGLDKSDLNNSSSSEYLDRSSGSSLGPPDDGKKSKLTRTKSAKNEPVFGSTLKALSIADESCIPKFVEKIIRVIESKEDYLETDGLYRASGNLSQVQNIRVKADLYQFQCIDQEEDVHVLSGALKLFFRELKEPAIPTWCFEKALEISGNKNRNERVKKFRELLSTFPKENYETLKFLFTHLLKVTEYREKNRMHVSNLAIVFGPTLMWPATESLNLALDMMQQNLVIESLLIEFKQVFVK